MCLSLSLMVKEINIFCQSNGKLSAKGRKSKLAETQVFIDTSTTNSMPLAPSKKESNSIILIKKDMTLTF